jgi:hypothetical protein
MKIEEGVLIKIEDNDIDSDGQCVIPYGVTVIGEEAFVISNVKSVIIPNSVTRINKSAFSHCTHLNKVVIPDSVNCIEEKAFDRCVSLTEVILSNNISNIKNQVFLHCSFDEIIIPNNVTSID